MLVLEIELLTGRYVAKQFDDHATAEWPPHPARVFSALAAAHFDDPVAGDESTVEREALNWLAALPAPHLYASYAAHRTVLDAFVPTNDKSINPSVMQAAYEASFGADDHTRAVAHKKLEKIEWDASQLVSPTEDQRSRLTAAVRQVERALTAGYAGGATSALERLRTLANDMDAEVSSKLLTRAIGKVATLQTGDANLPKQLKQLRNGLRPGEVLKRAVSVLPTASERRQPRTFPSVFAYDPIVQLMWAEEPAQCLREAISALAARVTRLGHSSSLVRLALIDEARAATWIPDPRGPVTLRWVSARQLEDLAAAYGLHRGIANRVLPYDPVNYRHAAEQLPRPHGGPESSSFGADWSVFQLLGRERLPIVRSVDLATALRRALLRQVHAGVCGCDRWPDESGVPSWADASHCYDRIPMIVSGLESDGSRSRQPHVASVALPFVEFPHADGSILGVAAVLPRSLVGNERETVLRALGSIQTLTLSGGLAFEVRRIVERQPDLRTLDPLLWCRPGTVWATVTPILLDRYPGNVRSKNAIVAERAENEALEAIARACEHIGLPRPRMVSLVAPCFRGSAGASQFMRHERRGTSPRVRVHALIDFGAPVRGPVLLGAGRYVGLGLCRPFIDEPQS